MLSGPARVPGATWWCWQGRRMVAFGFALTFPVLMLAQKRTPTPAQNTEGIGEFGRCWTFFLLRPQIRVLADKDERGIEAVHYLHSRYLGFFKCNCMPLRLCNVLAMFQQLIQIYLDKLNLIYCLMYLDNLIVFSQTTEEHLHHLHVVLE